MKQLTKKRAANHMNGLQGCAGGLYLVSSLPLTTTYPESAVIDVAARIRVTALVIQGLRLVQEPPAVQHKTHGT